MFCIFSIDNITSKKLKEKIYYPHGTVDRIIEDEDDTMKIGV